MTEQDSSPNNMTNVIDPYTLDNATLSILCAMAHENYTKCYLEDEINSAIYPRPYEWVFITLHTLVFIIGLTGNALICLFVYRNRHLRNVTNYFIVNLAVADFLVILICLPPTVLWDITNTWFLGDLMCKLVVYFQFVSVSVSVLTLTFISVDRWYAICRPLKFKSTITKTRLAIIFIWIASLAINSPDLIHLKTNSPFYTNETIYYTDCAHDWSGETERIYQLWIVITYFLLPIILMSVAYHQIAIVLWNKNIPGSGETGQHYHHHNPPNQNNSSHHHVNNSSQSQAHSNSHQNNHHLKSYPESSSSIEMNSTNFNNNNDEIAKETIVTTKRSDYGGKSGKDSQFATSTNNGHKRTVTSKNTSKYPYDSQVTSRQRVAKMLIAVVIMFGLCYLPVHVLNLLRCFISIPQNDVISILSLSSHWLCYANSAINPIIYNFMSAKFRKEFQTTFQNLCGLRCCGKKRRLKGSAMESATRRQSNQTQYENINLNSVARHNGS
ncbi:orexin/Hypocretin receptor type 1-like isoform X2 [Panonychus citri]|uniref:orexin/Hypocretin receptor type 1-like isoform X2 n=1 Tax=Panonychus citri TaxID=50023 RepID=UPI002307A6A3|nr:orexin/Hypocretin receptor type 1-like isoform X2 [Panonychus citri]